MNDRNVLFYSCYTRNYGREHFNLHTQRTYYFNQSYLHIFLRSSNISCFTSPLPLFHVIVLIYLSFFISQRVTEDFKQKILVLESDLTEALDELSDALEREKDFEACLESSQLREKALVNKQKRMEETCREQENEIQYLTLTKPKDKDKPAPEAEKSTTEAGTMTDFPFYSERAIDVGGYSSAAGYSATAVNGAFSDIDLKDSGDSPPHPQGDSRPEGVDLLSSTGTLLRKKNEIMREAKRRRTARSKKGQRRDVRNRYGPEPEYEKARAKAERKTLFSRLCCCVKQQSAEYEVDPEEDRARVRYNR